RGRRHHRHPHRLVHRGQRPRRPRQRLPADRHRRRDGHEPPLDRALNLRADQQLLRARHLLGPVHRSGVPPMGNVGLLLVGVVLLVNGLAAPALVPPRAAARLNFSVGTAQVVPPTIILIPPGSPPAVLNATWPSYLFGITYLWFGFQTV